MNFLSLIFLSLALPHVFGVFRTSWRYHLGSKPSTNNCVECVLSTTTVAQDGTVWNRPEGCAYTRHVDECVYDIASVPQRNDLDWHNCGPSSGKNAVGNPYCPNADTIDMTLPSQTCPHCSSKLDFTYFDSFVYISSLEEIQSFQATLRGLDDGMKLMIFNEQYPNGTVLMTLGYAQSGEQNVSGYVVAGENRFVIVQVDDCCDGDAMQYAEFIVNGDMLITVPPSPEPCAARYEKLNQDGSMLQQKLCPVATLRQLAQDYGCVQDNGCNHVVCAKHIPAEVLAEVPMNC